MSEPYKLYQGDNLAVMRGLPSESIDLIYIDPPYFSQRNYGDFDDRWKSMQHYLDFMVERLKEMHRLLKQTGSIYVHLDWHAVHYVKVEMDKIFGYKNLVNEIVWHHDMGGRGKSSFAKKHDTILFYKKDKYIFNPILIPFQSGMTAWRYSQKNKEPPQGKVLTDVWSFTFNTMSSERLGYQTQKPVELMERIILASSNEGDLVADFFCGSGSFIKKAFELGRRCTGCDVSPKALALAHCPTKRAPDAGESAASQTLSPQSGESTPEVVPAATQRR